MGKIDPSTLNLKTYDVRQLITDFSGNFPNIDPELHWHQTPEQLHKEFFWYLDQPGNCTINCCHNKIIKYSQQDNFFATEKALWKDDDIKVKLIANRLKYLNKEPYELTTYDMLSGFKKSAIHYGYSGFNPLLAKWFFQRYNVDVCYDPCGGWGHRALGATDIEKYIYNDLSESTAQSVYNMVCFFDMFNIDVRCNDARSYVPKESFDGMFTCPPYYNVEHYECGDFESMADFDSFIDSLFDIYKHTASCRVFGLVIREDLIGKHTDYTERIELHTRKSEHIVSSKRFNEYLFIYKK